MDNRVQLRPRLRELHTAVMRRRVSTWAVSVTGTAVAASALLRTSGAASSCSSLAEVLTFITSVCSSNSLGAHPVHPPQLYSTSSGQARTWFHVCAGQSGQPENTFHRDVRHSRTTCQSELSD